MPKQIWTPVGRLVQGGFKLHPKMDDNDKPVIDTKTGQPVMECYFAIAVPKLDAQGQPNPDFARWWAELNSVAATECAAFYDAAQGRATHPGFSWKYQDGDGVDGNGKSVANKPGFAGCHIIKMSTQFPPRGYEEGKFAPNQVLQDPDAVIKKGYYVRAYCRVAGNGVTAADKNKKPGVFVSPELVSLVAYGEVIVSGVDAEAAAKEAPALVLPAGASATPIAGSVSAAPPAPGAAPAGLAPPPAPSAAPGGMAPPPAPGGMAPPPAPAPAPAQPQWKLVGSMAGYSLDALIASGWTEQMLKDAGHLQLVQ